jgi:hypothetical protein
MKKYLIRYNAEAIMACIALAPDAQITGFSENLMVTDLKTGMRMLTKEGYDISPLLEEYNKPEDPQE